MQVVLGVVYAPVLDEMFTAIQGKGSFCNGLPLHVAECEDLQSALIATELGVARDERTVDAVFDRVAAVAAASRSVRCTGSCAMNLCGVALGRLDGFYEIGFGGPWDVAAASLIVTEAGGEVLDPSGRHFDVMSRRVLAGSPKVAAYLAGILKRRKLSEMEPQEPAARPVNGLTRLA